MCDMNLSVFASSAVVRADEPVTLTMAAAAACPEMYEHEAVIAVVGGISTGSLQDVRASLLRLVDVFSAAHDSRIAVISAASPRSEPRWAVSADDFAALRREIHQIDFAENASDVDLSESLATAQRLADGIGVLQRPFVVVFEGQGGDGAWERSLLQLQRLSRTVADGAGLTALLDATPGHELLDRFRESFESGARGVAGREVTASFEDEVGTLVNAFGGPLQELVIGLAPDRGDPVARVTTEPEAQWSTDLRLEWIWNPVGYRASTRARAVARIPSGGQAIPIRVFASVKRAAPLEDRAKSVLLQICVADPPPAALACPSPTPTPSAPRPTPLPPGWHVRYLPVAVCGS